MIFIAHLTYLTHIDIIVGLFQIVIAALILVLVYVLIVFDVS